MLAIPCKVKVVVDIPDKIIEFETDSLKLTEKVKELCHCISMWFGNIKSMEVTFHPEKIGMPIQVEGT